MKLYNSHTHTQFSHDGKGSITELCEEAKKQSLFGFTVTDHCDCEYSEKAEMLYNIDKSFYETEKAKLSLTGKSVIACGVEIGDALYNEEFAKKIIASHKWDCILGSVHAVKTDYTDIPFSLIDFSVYSSDMIFDYISRYFDALLKTAKTTDYDILSHLTVILRYTYHKYGKITDITYFYPVIEEILKTVIARNKTLEINTSGKHDGYLMPDTDIIEMYKKLGGKKISLGSDSHIPKNISSGLIETSKQLKIMGFDKITYYLDRKPFKYEI